MAGESFADLLKRLRQASGLTQEDLAGRAEVSPRTISDLERGVNRTARKDTTRLLAEALGLSGPLRQQFESTAQGRTGGLRDAPLLVPVTPLIGRNNEVRTASELLRGAVRLVTLTGLGGVGKTRTAFAVAHELLGDFADGVFFVNVADSRDESTMMQTFTLALGIRDSGALSPLDVLASALRDRELLVFLDNFEQLIESSPVISMLLTRCPGLKFLVTSRRPLRVTGEYELAVKPLPVPVPGAALEDVRASPAVSLFAQRVQAVHTGWELDESNAAVVTQICRRLDGLPLALELAAARTNVLTLGMLAERLADAMGMLSAGRRDAAPRQQSLRATLSWSYELLDDDAKRLLTQLTIFSGGWSLEAMEFVCRADLGTLATLIENSLVWRTDHSSGPRFTLPYTVREYAAAALDDTSDVAVRHMKWFLSFAEAAARELPRSRQLDWMNNVDLEYGNLRQALGFAVENQDAEVAQRLAAALWRYWEIRGLLTEGRQWMEAAIAIPGPVSTTVGAHVRKAAGNLARDQGDLRAAEEFYSAAQAMYDEISDISGVASVINNLGNVRLDSGDYEAAGLFYQQSLDKFRAIEDPWNVALLLNNLALALRISDLRRAAHLAEESAELFHKIGDRRSEGRALETLGRVLDLRGDHQQAMRNHRRALVLRHNVGDLAGVARSLEGLAHSYSETGGLRLAAWLLGQAEYLREITGEALTRDDGVGHTRTLDILRRDLPPDVFSTALSKGRTSELAEVIRALDLDP